MKICDTATTVWPMKATGNRFGEAEKTVNIRKYFFRRENGERGIYLNSSLSPFIHDPNAVPKLPISTAFLNPCSQKHVKLNAYNLTNGTE